MVRVMDVSPVLEVKKLYSDKVVFPVRSRSMVPVAQPELP
jgi:hypothetical protein